MKCPDCQVEMKEIDYRGITIHECPDCQGRWFDRGELTKAKDRTDEDLRWFDFDPFKKEAGKFEVPSEGRRCPRCGAKTESLTYRDSGVAIDKCSRCRGVWLHHGEFEKIVEYLENKILNEPASEYARDTVKQLIEIFNDPPHVGLEIKDFFVVLKLLEERFGAEHPRIAQAARNIFERF